MNGFAFFFTLVGICKATSWLFRLVDKLEGR